EEVTKEKLGGAMSHNSVSGVAHFASPGDTECLASIRKLLSYLPSNNAERPPVVTNVDPLDREIPELDDFVPSDPNKPYDITKLIRWAADEGEFLEVHQHFAKNIVVGFIRLGGRTVGVIANQPAHLAGVLDINASVKGARFVRFCDAFNGPLWIVEDVPGFLPGTEPEWGGIIRHGAKLLFALAEATVPKVTVITRKAYGGAYDVMSSKHHGGDINYAYPTAEIAVMGPEGAVNIVFRKEIQKAENPEKTRQRMVEDYRSNFASPFRAAELGYIDQIIFPENTRPRLIQALEMLNTKQDSIPARRHGNIPL
ncbi:MAG: methylmalonyl-CoA carboxyltransferase, partial [Deltaproteobacteria bacterium]